MFNSLGKSNIQNFYAVVACDNIKALQKKPAYALPTHKPKVNRKSSSSVATSATAEFQHLFKQTPTASTSSNKSKKDSGKQKFSTGTATGGSHGSSKSKSKAKSSGTKESNAYSSLSATASIDQLNNSGLIEQPNDMEPFTGKVDQLSFVCMCV